MKLDACFAFPFAYADSPVAQGAKIDSWWSQIVTKNIVVYDFERFVCFFSSGPESPLPLVRLDGQRSLHQLN